MDESERERDIFFHQAPRRVSRIRTVSVPSQPSSHANGSLKPGRRALSPINPLSSTSYALSLQTLSLRLIDQICLANPTPKY